MRSAEHFIEGVKLISRKAGLVAVFPLILVRATELLERVRNLVNDKGGKMKKKKAIQL